MKERGEIISLSLLLVLGISSLLILMSLELKRDFSHLRQRGKLFLCAKETKGELTLFLEFMGKSNWAINNLHRVSMISLFIPGLQGISANSAKVKQGIQTYQNLKLISFLKNLAQIKSKSCPIDLDLFKTPFEISLNGFKRNENGGAQLRQETIDYTLTLKPYSLLLSLELTELENLHPRFSIKSKEKKAIRLFRLSQVWQ